MIECRGRGNCAGRQCQAARGVGVAGSGGGGKRVNRESTCKQATRETNNVGAAGCSPPNEASRQEAGRRQAGRQAGLCSDRFVAVRSVFCARLSVHRYHSACLTYQIARAANRADPRIVRRSQPARDLRAAAVAAIRKAIEIRNRSKEKERRKRREEVLIEAARNGSMNLIQPISLISRKKKRRYFC